MVDFLSDNHPTVEAGSKYCIEDPPEQYAKYCREFVKMGPEVRRAELLRWDGVLEEETRPSRQVAQVIQIRRELSDLHNVLLRSQR